jgi:hypothetical protein
MPRNDYDYDFDDEYDLDDEDEFDSSEELYFDDEDELEPDGRAGHSGEQDVRISMEVDERGNEIWFAKDPRVPGSGSMGHSAEEAVEGLEERRRKFREMLRKSRERKKD